MPLGANRRIHGWGGQTLNAGTRGAALRLRNKYGTSCEPVSLRSGSSHLDTIHPQLSSHRHDNRYHDDHLLHAKDQELQLPTEMQGVVGGGGGGEQERERSWKNRENDRDGEGEAPDGDRDARTEGSLGSEGQGRG